jgi:FkbM family methyltransferase
VEGGVIQRDGLWFPDGIPLEKWDFSFRHVKSLEWSLSQIKNKRKRTALQAGGNVGLWPRRMAEVFNRVISFEPDGPSREALIANVPPTVEVHAKALGEANRTCSVKRCSTGSHRILLDGEGIEVITIDSLGLADLDFLQLDIEGYEWHALTGAAETIERCHPQLIQVELRQHTLKYGKTPELVRELLASHGYQEVSRQRGQDFVFARP